MFVASLLREFECINYFLRSVAEILPARKWKQKYKRNRRNIQILIKGKAIPYRPEQALKAAGVGGSQNF
jgi:hypothetical protein